MTFTWQTLVAAGVLAFVVLLGLQWIGLVPIAGASEHRVTICHIPPGNPDNTHTITVGSPAVSAHLRHGDTIGACSEDVTATPTSGQPQEPGQPTATPRMQEPVVTEASSTQQMVAPKSLPVTGGVEGDLGGGNVWAAWLLVAGFLSTGMAFVMRIRS